MEKQITITISESSRHQFKFGNHNMIYSQDGFQTKATDEEYRKMLEKRICDIVLKNFDKATYASWDGAKEVTIDLKGSGIECAIPIIALKIGDNVKGTFKPDFDDRPEDAFIRFTTDDTYRAKYGNKYYPGYIPGTPADRLHVTFQSISGDELEWEICAMVGRSDKLPDFIPVHPTSMALYQLGKRVKREFHDGEFKYVDVPQHTFSSEEWADSTWFWSTHTYTFI